MYLKDTKGEKSLTATVFVVGAIICLFKLLFSGMVIYGFAIPEFTGAAFSISMTSLGGIYTLRRSKFMTGESGDERTK